MARRRMDKRTSRQITVLLPQDVADALEARAASDRRTRSQLAAILIEDGLGTTAAAQKVG